MEYKPRKAGKNQDLWKELLEEFVRLRATGINVQLWQIPRALNGVADQLAKEAAALPPQDYWLDASGVAV